jgi:HAD superfamily hydrolase (TIGR01459 family)
MQRLHSIRQLDSQYDAVLCDVWGVVHDGRSVFPGVVDALRDLRRAGVIVVLLTNVPRPSRTLPAALARLGLPGDTWDGIVTSGDAIRVELARRSPGPMHRLGRDTDVGLWEGLGLELADLPDASFAAIAGLRGPAESPRDYGPALAQARARDLELLCANPDIQVQSGDRLLWCAGAVARDYVALGGRVVQAGKPFAPIYRRAGDEVDRLAGRRIPAGRVLAIGDGIATDILGANRMGLDSLFIGTGVHGTALLSHGHLDVARAGSALARAGAVATYAMAWLS